MFVVLDLDEVLVDFTGGAAKAHGLSLDGMREKFGGTFWSGPKFWDGITRYGENRFWKELSFLPWSADLVLWVDKISRGNWIIATSPSRARGCPFEEAYTGKLRFLAKAYGEDFHRFEIMEDKSLLAKEGRLLIDDSEMMCKKFRAAGGEAIQFPSRFNSKSLFYSDPLTYVKEEYNALNFSER